MKRMTKHFLVNTVAYDTQAKEYVLISNGVCTKDHTSNDGFARSHPSNDSECIFAASEALALRVVPSYEGTPELNWTYRHVEERFLSEVSTSLQESFKRTFDKTFNTRKANNHRLTSVTAKIGGRI